MKPSTKYPLLLTSALAVAFTPFGVAQDGASATEEADRTLETVIVRGEFIPEPQRETSQVASFLSEEDLVRSGDANAALALTRLSGLSVVSDKFAFVRGLGDRYSSALLNGSPLPSPEPLRRTVPLDLFPSDILGGAAVQKTFSANYPAEFGGGVIDLQTLRIPAENFFNVKIGAGINTETTLKDGLYVRGSDTDWTGYDDGLRDLPGPLQTTVAQGLDLGDQDDAFVEALGESLVNSPLSVIQDGELGPNLSISANAGRNIGLGEFDLGLVGTVGFDSGWKTERAVQQLAFESSEIIRSDIESEETSYDATLNALGSAALGWGTNEIQATVFYVHTTSKEAQISTGSLEGSQNGDIFTEQSGWYERELTFTQLRGEHELSDFLFNWRGSYSLTTRDAPYERTLNRFLRGGDQPFYAGGNNYRVSFSELEDENFSFGADGAYTFVLGDFRELVVSAGGDYSSTDRDSKILNLRYEGGDSLSEEVGLLRPDLLFSPDNIGPFFEIDTIDRVFDFYTGELDITSAYVQAEMDLTDFINATIGARYEEAEQTIVTTSRFGQIGSTTDLENEYFLPAVTITWNFADDLQWRLGYSETISRPQFRELSPSIFSDPDSDREFRGNAGLVDTEFTNFDTRLEYYLGRNQFVTLAAFYKEIINPIEEYSFIPAGSGALRTSFINAPKAELSGLEFEYRTKFAMPFDQHWFNDRDWLFSFNYTFTDTEISATDADQILDPLTGRFFTADLFAIDGERLQGTPENIVNMQFGWESEVEQATLLLNWVDERILQRGRSSTLGVPVADIVEDPGVQLDFVYRRDLVIQGQDLTFGFSARNLLNEANEEFQLNDNALGRTEFNTYDRGVSVSTSLTARF